MVPKSVLCLHMAMGEVDQDDYPYHTTATLLTRPLKDSMDMVEGEHIPSYNFRPKEEDIILVRAEGETYFSWARVVPQMSGVRTPRQSS